MTLSTRLQDGLQDLKNWDAARPSIPGEHLAAFGAGALLLLFAARRPSMMGKAIALAAAAALVLRSVSGRDGLLDTVTSAGTVETDADNGPDVAVESPS